MKALLIAALFCPYGANCAMATSRRGATVVSLANAYHGYLPTPEHHALGGYETWRARSSYLEGCRFKTWVTQMVQNIGNTLAGGEGCESRPSCRGKRPEKWTNELNSR